jgi:hypothetical protein
VERNIKNHDSINKADTKENKQNIDFLETTPRDDEECFSAIAIQIIIQQKKKKTESAIISCIKHHISANMILYKKLVSVTSAKRSLSLYNLSNILQKTLIPNKPNRL